jgi:hypothetical protein
MARLLDQAAPGLFQRVETLTPHAGDQLFAYASAATLSELGRTLPAGVLLRGHGPGFGLIVSEESALASEEQCERCASELAPDLVLFDQRGCLSPRLVLLHGSMASALRLGRAIGQALSVWEVRAPLGRVDPDEQAAITRYRDTLAYAGEIVAAGRSVIGVGERDTPPQIAPEGRNLQILPVSDAVRSARELAPSVTSYAVFGSQALSRAVGEALPDARRALIGHMQCPPFDGPVDRRRGRGTRGQSS